MDGCSLRGTIASFLQSCSPPEGSPEVAGRWLSIDDRDRVSSSPLWRVLLFVYICPSRVLGSHDINPTSSRRRRDEATLLVWRSIRDEEPALGYNLP